MLPDSNLVQNYKVGVDRSSALSYFFVFYRSDGLLEPTVVIFDQWLRLKFLCKINNQKFQ